MIDYYLNLLAEPSIHWTILDHVAVWCLYFGALMAFVGMCSLADWVVRRWPEWF